MTKVFRKCVRKTWYMFVYERLLNYDLTTDVFGDIQSLGIIHYFLQTRCKIFSKLLDNLLVWMKCITVGFFYKMEKNCRIKESNAHFVNRKSSVRDYNNTLKI